MKVLIWVGCCFAYGFITTLIKQFGIVLGGIPTLILAGGMFWLARTLCKKYDEHRTQKNSDKNHMQKSNEE